MKRVKMKCGNVVWFLVVCFCLISTLSSAATLLEWKFDGNTNDSSGNSKNGTITEGTPGSVNFVDAGRNGSIQFTNTKDRVVSPTVNIGSAFTVAGWIKVADGFSGSWNRFLCTDDHKTGFFIGQDSTSGKWKFAVNNNFALPIGGNIVPGQWQHVAGTYNGTQGRLYVNGVLVSGPAAMPVPSTPNQPFVLGKDKLEQNNGFPGLFDEIKVYNTALSATEILSLYNAEYLQSVTGPIDQAVWLPVSNQAHFEITINKGNSSTVTGVQWYKKLSAGDPNILIVDDNIKYDIVSSQASSTLTVYDVDTGDTPYLYFAVVTLDSGLPSVIQSQQAALALSTGLVHRWSFSGNLTDSIGGANGTLYDPNGWASYADGNTQLLLDNPLVSPGNEPNNVAYVELPDNIVSPLHDYMTIEMWMTPHRIIAPSNWIGPLFAFGQDNDADPRNTSGGAGFNAILQTPTSGPSVSSGMPGAIQRWSDPAQATVDEEFMLAMVWDGNAGTGTLYIDGVSVAGPVNLPVKLSDIADVDNYIGHNWWSDVVMNASINEMRIYDYPLPEYYVATHAAAGPDAPDVIPAPALSDPLDVGVYPALRGDDVDSATFTVTALGIPAGTTITTVQWYKDPDPGTPGDEILLSDGTKYSINFADPDSSLTINDVEGADEAYYYAVVTLDTSAATASSAAKLTVSTGLVHRWSFSGDLTDSIGGANGTLYDPASHAYYNVGSTQLFLDNPQVSPGNEPNNVAYVELPDNIVSPLHDYMTIEMWLTPHRIVEPTVWIGPLFAFGQDNDADPRNFSGGTGVTGILQTPSSGPSVGIDMPGANRRWSDPAQATVDEEFMLAMVWDGNTGTGTLYIDGVAVAGPVNLPVKLSDIFDVDNYIGHNWWSNGVMNASINEIRIYDWAFESPWIEAHLKAGADVVSVNPCMVKPQFDLNDDCEVDLSDFALLAAEWLACGRLEPCN